MRTGSMRTASRITGPVRSLSAKTRRNTTTRRRGCRQSSTWTRSRGSLSLATWATWTCPRARISRTSRRPSPDWASRSGSRRRAQVSPLTGALHRFTACEAGSCVSAGAGMTRTIRRHSPSTPRSSRRRTSSRSSGSNTSSRSACWRRQPIPATETRCHSSFGRIWEAATLFAASRTAVFPMAAAPSRPRSIDGGRPATSTWPCSWTPAPWRLRWMMSRTPVFRTRGVSGHVSTGPGSRRSGLKRLAAVKGGTSCSPAASRSEQIMTTEPRNPGRLAHLSGVLIVTAALCLAANAAGPRFFSDDPIQQEPITQDVTKAVRYEPDLTFQTLEGLFGHPGGRSDVRAQNVNTVDEVPDGPFYVNRAGKIELTPEIVARASNTSDGPAPGPWTVVSAKSDGITPGFTIRDSAKTLWFIKFDPPGWKGMATGSEVVAAKLFWSVGYHTVEYYIGHLAPSNLV